jgi:hypothetical protein
MNLFQKIFIVLAVVTVMYACTWLTERVACQTTDATGSAP